MEKLIIMKAFFILGTCGFSYVAWHLAKSGDNDLIERIIWGGCSCGLGVMTLIESVRTLEMLAGVLT